MHARRKNRERAEWRGADIPVAVSASLPNVRDRERYAADVSDLFGFGVFYDPYSESVGESTVKKSTRHRKTARIRAIIWRLKMLSERTKETIVSKAEAVRARRSARQERASPLPMLCGALCAILCVFALSAGIIGYRMLLKDRVLRFERVEIPALLGLSYDEASLDGALFRVELNYEYDSSAPQGTVIEQTPSAGVIRRVYRGGEPCKLSLTVSLGERFLVMSDYTAKSARDALLELKNESVKFEISEQYSDTVEAGCVISTEPAAGEQFAADEVVRLTLSLGKERKFVAIPDLFGLTEVRAAEVLRTLGFEVGEIKYVASQSACGTVISQSATAYSLLELGARVDLNISAGMGFSQKTVPDLYGLTVDQAREALAEVGLVCGTVYTVQSTERRATVVSQSISAGTPITAGIVSVDIYVSS